MNSPQNTKTNEIVTDALDHSLDAHFSGSTDELTPSSGFVVSVMEAIHAESAEPSPIAFPWRRVVPGIVAIACGLVCLIIFAVRGIGASSGVAVQSHMHFGFSMSSRFTPGETALGWVLVAACLSIAAIAASFRLAGRSQ